MSAKKLTVEEHQVAIKQQIDELLKKYGDEHKLEAALEIVLHPHWQIEAAENRLLANNMPYVLIAVKEAVKEA